MVCTYHFSKKKSGNQFVAMTLLKQRRKKLWEWICDNVIVEIEKEKKNCGNEFVAMTLLKQEGKKIIVIGLWQQHCRNTRKKKKNYLIFGNSIAKIGNWRRERERNFFLKKVVHIFLFFNSFFDLFCVYVMFLPCIVSEESINQSYHLFI